jgi:hypothetical protein
MKKAKTILKSTLEEYGYNLSDYIRPTNGLEMAITEAMERYAEDYHESKVKAAVEKKASSIPDFITEQTCKMVVELWDAPNINNNNPRVAAIKLIGAEGEKNGFRMDLKRMCEIKDLILETYKK